MARNSSDFPIRIAAIAVVIVVLLGLLVWALSGLGTPSPSPTPSEGSAAGPDDGEDGANLVPPLPEPGESPDAAEDAAAPGDRQLPPLPEDGDSLTLQLYLSNGSSGKLFPRVRRLDAPFDLPTQAQMALDALINAGEPGYVSPLPAETVVREVWVDEASGTAYVDLARNFPEVLGGGSLTELHAVYSIVGTLTGTFPQIHRVQLLVGGRPVDTLNGHLDVSGPLVPLDDWLY